MHIFPTVNSRLWNVSTCVFFFFPFLRTQVRHWFPCTSHASAAPASTWAARCLVIFVQDAHHCFLFFFLSSYAFSQTWYTTCYKLFIQVILSVRDARLERSYFKTQVKHLLQILMIPHSNNHIRECLMLLNRFHLTSLIIIGAQGRSQPSWSLGSSSQESWGPQTR